MTNRMKPVPKQRINLCVYECYQPVISNECNITIYSRTTLYRSENTLQAERPRSLQYRAYHKSSRGRPVCTTVHCGLFEFLYATAWLGLIEDSKYNTINMELLLIIMVIVILIYYSKHYQVHAFVHLICHHLQQFNINLIIYYCTRIILFKKYIQKERCILICTM